MPVIQDANFFAKYLNVLKANDFTVESLDWVCFSDLGIVGAYLVVIARLGTGVEIDIDVENIFERNIPLRERYECPL